jgi:hypothetical protein
VSQFGNIAESHITNDNGLEGRTMANNDEFSDCREAKFSFGVRELEQAEARQKGDARGLSVVSIPGKSANDARGFDPYNTSGNFDRKKNWERVGRR